MKVKTFILSLFLTMFCSTSFGQHWGEIPNHYEGNMTFVTQIFIDDVLQGEDIEIGAFCGNEFRGSARPIASQSNMVYLLIEGDGDHNGDQISFKLARHYANAPSEELDYVIFNALTYEHNARIGASPADLVNGLLPEDDRDRTEFNSVASLNGEVYPSLANALAACTTGNNTIELLKDNAEDVTIKQVEGVNVTIDGGTSRYDYSGTITIHGNARYQGAETLTFTNIDFTTDKAGHYFIDSNSTGSVERYAHNVTVDDCNFTATGAGINSAVAMRIRQGYNIAINGGEFAGLHSVLQAYGNAGINITGIESNCKNGISVGSSTNVVITNSEITATGATGYGVRAGENVTGPLEITDTKINAFIPVSVRGVDDDTDCEFTFTGNTMTASNTDGYWCVIGTSEYEANGSLPETAGKIIVNATEQDLAGVYGYSRVEVTFDDNTTKYFYKMEDAVPYNDADNYEGATIKLLSNCAGRGLRFWENDMTFDLNGKKYTITQAVGSSGTESQGFQIRPEVTGNVTIKNGTIDIKAGTNVKWMFNSYAADFVVKDVTIDGTNMVTNTSEDYLLVVQNAGDKATFDNVTIQNYDAKKVYLEGNTTFVTPQEFDNIEIPADYVLVYENGAYIVKAGNVLNANTGAKYATLADAVTAATAGDTLVLLADITEDVTVNKDLTINGDNKQYTGNISVETSSTDITVKNVNFVNGTGYAITTNRIKSVTVENCTVTNYGFGFLYANKSTPTVVVKNVTVDGGNYGFHWVYGTTATLENVTMTNVTYGLYIQNYAGKTINVKNSTISSIDIWERSGSSGVQTFKFEGDNTVTTLTDSQYAKYVLAATDATLTAPEGANVTSGVQDYGVEYANGKYFLSELNYVAKIGEVKYISLQAAIDAAQGGNVIEVIDNINVGKDDVVILEDANGRDKYNTFFKVEGKAITINLNGHNITGDVLDIEPLGGFGLIAIFSIQKGGNLTLNDNGNTSTVKIDNSTVNNVYSLISCYDEGTGSKLTINGGNYTLEKAGDNLVHSAGDDAVIINGGTFTLVNVGEDGPGSNYNPWIFNANGKNQRNVIVNGGTFNFDINHQFWANEVYVPETLALQNNGDGTWTVVESVAYAVEKATSSNAIARNVGYATLAEAVNPLGNPVNDTVTVIKAHETTVPAIVERDMTIDFASLAITGNVYPVVRIQNDANVTVKNGNITNNDYVFVLGASDGSSAGNLTIESGVYTGTTTVASVTKGLLTINGGEFKVNDSEYGATYMINCIDANYNDDSANVEIYGGKFYGFNPENNAAEGANTNFCALGYGAIENTPNVWTVVPKQTAEVKDGWNWFSYYVEGDVLDQLQNSLGTVGVQIKSRMKFTQYEDGSWDGSLQYTTPAESYKINVNADAVINVTGNIVDPSTCYIMLNNGGNNVGAWNWIGYPLAQETSVETAFEGVVKNGDEVKTRTGFAEYVNGQWWGPLMTLEPGVGYMYFRAGANETVSNFTYPTPSSKEAVQPNITADANLWVPNSTSYANNMTMVAVLNMNGEMMNDNYEVAAMVNGEVRGSARPIYVEPMDAYMLFLTIHGEGVEEVTFQCYDFNTDTEYVLNNTINYSDDARLGSVNEPYVLCYGTMGIGENAMNTINIYPNPTTTGREINLGATCDKVEVYNALGVKVAEYQNVDTLDAIETAGIYVIRVTNDGDVKHCRLVVK